ncbi:TetR/AcrR family transcriptional regulator [Nocardia pseudovaccinii]|uniref:TetR/AcrR family transcriptional regulator n=1 Tax=Nocardia pseudovaccinii TaxID=189540 RepID=UPI0007A539B1|nr:TetR/AcrR family transcriptional regulator [Nocardia pseudovaccinii]
MPRVPAKERRRQFIDATVRVIAEHGVKAATTRRIAEAADAPLASLHYCFHTKEELFLAVFEEMADAIVQNVLNSEASTKSLADSAPEHLREAVDWMTENRNFGRAQNELANWATRHDPAMAAQAYDLSFEAARRSFLRAADADRYSAAAVDSAVQLSILLLDGLLMSWCAYDDRDRLEGAIGTACDALRTFCDRLTTTDLDALTTSTAVN